MKKFILVLIVIVLSSCATINHYQYSKAYQKDIDNILGWQKGETKKQFSKRYNYEIERLKHKHFHHKNGLPVCCNECEHCLIEMQEIIALQEEEEKQYQEELLAKEKRLEEERLARIAEEERLEKEKIAQIAREEKIIKEIDSLRICFLNENLKEIKSKIKTIERKTNYWENEFKKIKKQRFNEVDILEKQYAGRLNGEIFITKKEALNEKYNEKYENISEKIGTLEYELKIFGEQYIKQFNELLSKNGYEYRFLNEEEYKNLRFELYREYKFERVLELGSYPQIFYTNNKLNKNFYIYNF